jgi:hypothetical protein
MRRFTFLWLCLAPFAASLVACGGSSSSPGSCQYAAPPTTGPGDTLDYFPAEVGRSWVFQEGSFGTVTFTVTGTQQVGTETAAVFTSSSNSSPVPSSELVVKRLWGVYLIDDGTSDPLTARTYPELILPFPVQVSPTSEQVRCTSIDAGDLDGDGRGDRADLVETYSLVSITETAVVPAGSFTDVAHLRKDLWMTLNSSSSGSLSVEASQDDYYARGVGRVAAHRTVTVVGGASQSGIIQLASFALPTPRLLSPGPSPAAAPPPALAAARPDEPASFEAATRRLAVSILGGWR